MTKKQDEIEFYDDLMAARNAGDTSFADEIAAKRGMHPNRAHSLLLKWSDKGWWNYGTSPRGGWFEREAPVSLREEEVDYDTGDENGIL